MDFVSTDTVIQLVKLAGSDAVLEGDMLKLYPKGDVPVVYRVPAAGLARRVIIEIGKRTGVQSHLFWNPTLMQGFVSPQRTPLVLVPAGVSRPDQKKKQTR